MTMTRFLNTSEAPPSTELAGAAGAKAMAVKPAKSLIELVRQIRDSADAALRELQSMQTPRHLGWRCTSCGETKHFTRAVPAEVAPPCPRCSGTTFRPI